MKKALLASAACAALGLAASSQAAVVATVTKMPGPVADTFGTGPLPGYSAYIVHLASDTGKITAVDFSDANKGFSSAIKGMHQDWFTSKGKVTTSEQGDEPSGPTSYDSFFLFPGNAAANVVVGSALAEDNDKTTSPFAPLNATGSQTGDVYGGGTFLRGAWGIVAAAQSTSMDVAYLVWRDADIPPTGLLVATPQVATEGGTVFTQVVIPGIPEPISASILGLSLMGMGLRRRRA
jgi:hypothetical protein